MFREVVEISLKLMKKSFGMVDDLVYTLYSNIPGKFLRHYDHKNIQTLVETFYAQGIKRLVTWFYTFERYFTPLTP